MVRLLIYLTPDSILPYLVQRGLLTHAALANDEWRARRVDDLRSAIEVKRPNGRGWLIKQPPRLSAHDVEGLDREAAIYALGSKRALGPGFSSLLPKLRHYDRGVHAMVLSLLPHENLWDAFRRPQFDPSLCGASVATSLAAVHAEPPTFRASLTLLPTTPPWILQLSADAESADLTASERRVLETIRSDDQMIELLNALGQDWPRDCLIHGDARLDNLIYRQKPTPRCWIVDWTLVRLGDPAWDVAGIVQSVLVLWLNSMSFGPEGSHQDTLRDAGIPQTLVRAFISEFVQKYLAARKIDQLGRATFVRRVAGLAGARLVQSAYEHARSTRSLMRRHVAMLKLARAAMCEPEGMAAEFMC